MSISTAPVAAASLGAGSAAGAPTKKNPPRTRTAVAIADARVAPEAR